MRYLLLVLACLAWAVPAAAQPADPLPSQAEVQALVDTGNYKEAIKKLMRLLDLRGRAAEGYDRYQLLMLRGEAQLQVKQAPLALDAFTQARKEAKDDTSLAVAVATVELIHRANNFVYTPKPKDKTTPPLQFDVLDRGARKGAFAAMFAEDFSTLAPKVQFAMQATTLDVLLALGQAILPLRSEELAGLGNNDKTKEALKGLGDHAHDLITKALAQMERDTARIENQANQLITRMIPVQDPSNPRNTLQQQQIIKYGLDGNMQQSLNNTIGTCEKLPPAVKALATTLSLDAGRFNDVLATASRLEARAVSVRDADYGNQPNTIMIR